MIILSLKELFKERKIPHKEVIQTYDSIADTVVVDLMNGTSVDAAQVALVSNVMSIASGYKNKKFAIKLMKGALAELESESFVESGRKLS